MSNSIWPAILLVCPIIFEATACTRQGESGDRDGPRAPGHSGGDLAPDGVPPEPGYATGGTDSSVAHDDAAAPGAVSGEPEPLAEPTSTSGSTRRALGAVGGSGTGGFAGSGGVGGGPVPASG
jgi:hypothetical protein